MIIINNIYAWICIWKGNTMSEENLTTYQLKVDKEIWKKFKGTSYLLGFNSANECLNHLIDDCVKRGDNGDN